MSTFRWYAPGKINLFLHITKQRSDGYHELQTIFQFINWYDELSFNITKSPTLILNSNIKELENNSNLVLKAAKLLQKEANVSKGALIHLKKNLPFSAGLGGGSSDAATTLIALNKLWQCDFSKKTLLALGSKLGADVPIFIHGKACWAEGTGEQFFDCNLSQEHYLIVKPDESISTRVLFSSENLKRNCKAQNVNHFDYKNLINVFEPLVLKKYPKIKENIINITAQIKEQGLNKKSDLIKGDYRMTGSGSCFFIPVKSNFNTQKISIPKNYGVKVIKTLNQTGKI